MSLLEAHVQEQNEELSAAREKTNIAITRMMTLETELKSKTSKLEDLETREEKWVRFNILGRPLISFPFRWRSQLHEISHEIQTRKEDSLKREEKLIDEINAKNDIIKEQSKILQQHDNNYFGMRGENETLKQVNQTLNQQTNQLKAELEELRKKEKRLTELLKTTEEHLASTKQDILELFVSRIDLFWMNFAILTLTWF